MKNNIEFLGIYKLGLVKCEVYKKNNFLYKKLVIQKNQKVSFNQTLAQLTKINKHDLKDILTQTGEK